MRIVPRFNSDWIVRIFFDIFENESNQVLAEEFLPWQIQWFHRGSVSYTSSVKKLGALSEYEIFVIKARDYVIAILKYLKFKPMNA